MITYQEVCLASNPMRPGIGSSRLDFEPDRLKAIDMDGWHVGGLNEWMVLFVLCSCAVCNFRLFGRHLILIYLMHRDGLLLTELNKYTNIFMYLQLWWFNVQCSGITNWMFLLKCISKVKVKIGRNQWKHGTSLNCFVSEFWPFFVLWWGKCSYKSLHVVLIVKSLSHCASCCPLVLLKITSQYLLQRCCLCISLMCTFYYWSFLCALKF